MWQLIDTSVSFYDSDINILYRSCWSNNIFDGMNDLPYFRNLQKIIIKYNGISFNY